ncbi:unnamed protein product [Cladocopium goreaui]|uniref:Uncharacterized protein n=1 Tax=Cladocopium goreaui TaxID=2562237 RepID=A0A9P1M2W4_9DINO|nr:unnamed protein product [Cladocopium goreaui]
MPSRDVDRRTKYREQEVAPHGEERRKQLQKIYEKNTTRISHLIYHISFLTALLIGRGKAKPKRTKKKQPVSVGVQAGGDVAVSRLDASVQTDPYEPRPVISGRTIRDLHARAEEREKTLNALAYELKKVMVENRKWAELAQQNLLKMGSQLG